MWAVSRSAQGNFGVLDARQMLRIVLPAVFSLTLGVQVTCSSFFLEHSLPQTTLMSVKRALQLVASFGLSVALLALLIHIAKIDVRPTLRHLRDVSWIAFAKLVLLQLPLQPALH